MPFDMRVDSPKKSYMVYPCVMTRNYLSYAKKVKDVIVTITHYMCAFKMTFASNKLIDSNWVVMT